MYRYRHRHISLAEEDPEEEEEEDMTDNEDPEILIQSLGMHYRSLAGSTAARHRSRL
jgi:hypothetical protein